MRGGTGWGRSRPFATRAAAVAAALVLSGCAGSGAGTPDLSDPLRTPAFASAVPSAAPASSIRWSTSLAARSWLLGGAISSAGALFMLSTTETPTGVDPLPAAVVATGSSATGRLGREVVVARAASQPFLVGDPGSGTILITTLGPDGSRRELRALDARAGSTRWMRPADLDGTSTDNSFFHVWGASNGMVVGQVLGDTTTSQPCALCALDVTTGRTRWSVAGPVAGSGLAVGAVVVGPDVTAAVLGPQGQAQLVVVDTLTGRELFRRTTDWAPDALWPSVLRCGPMTVAVERAPGSGGAVTAYDRRGSVVWSSSVLRPPIVDETTETAVLATSDGGVTARACATGARRWSWTAERVARDAWGLTVARSGFVVGNAGAAGMVVDVMTGKPVWQGRIDADNPAQWTGASYLEWGPGRSLVAYAGSREPVGVLLDGGLEHPVFLGP